jgi:hypothetical protein
MIRILSYDEPSFQTRNTCLGGLTVLPCKPHEKRLVLGKQCLALGQKGIALGKQRLALGQKGVALGKQRVASII